METSAGLPFVLVIDEAPPVVRMIELELGFQRLRTGSVLLSEGPVERAESLKPDAIVLGAPIPTPDVFEILTQLKQRVLAPVVFVSASGNGADSALALEMGADAILDRPFNPEDLGLRLRALLDHEVPEAAHIRRGPLIIDYLRRVAWNGERKLLLATNEWNLLLALAQSERVIPADDLLTKVWGPNYAGQMRSLDTWIGRLRVNIGDDPQNPSVILGDTTRGFWLTV